MPGWIVETIITPAPAAMTVAGGQPPVEATQHVLLQPAAAALTITGGQPLSGPVAIPTATTLTITGGQPQIRQARILEPSATTLTITGGQPVVTQATRLTPAAAAMTLTGGQPVVTSKAPAAYQAVGAGVSTSGSPSLSFTAAAGADVFAVINWDRSGGGVSTITYGGVAMTLVASFSHNNTSANGGVSIYRLAGAGNGAAKTLATTTSGLAWYYLNAISFTDVATVGTATATYGSSTVASQTITAPTNGVMLMVASSGAGAGWAYDFTAFSGQTNRFHATSNATSLALSTATASGATSATAAAAQAWTVVSIPLS
ncbi:minor tail protein [Mycobacterium phage Soul22]|uniref:Minor tail protein n=2 Tax=Gracegardnervirinae TaxID=2946632 RepID=A0A7D5FT43_9CAUD|nr:minor tail protein [Mycobacterium phage Estave1]YP_009963841.1 minor tail protein [Mycobacterium phage Soul22]AIM40410.1 minor tail protein [Mycobacterium phage Estave1]QLF84248.1 minor tail protein [Mycobacterium phage Soul22]